MKTFILKLIVWFVLMLGGTSLIAQVPDNELQNTNATESQNVNEQNKPVGPDAEQVVPFAIFPNPAKAELYVRMTTDPSTQSTLQIFNPLWQEIYHRNVTGISDLTVDISSYAEGTYYVRLTTGHNQIQVRKLQILP